MHTYVDPFILVRCSYGMRESGSNNKLVDVAHSLSYMGIYHTLVLIYSYI